MPSAFPFFFGCPNFVCALEYILVNSFFGGKSHKSFAFLSLFTVVISLLLRSVAEKEKTKKTFNDLATKSIALATWPQSRTRESKTGLWRPAVRYQCEEAGGA